MVTIYRAFGLRVVIFGAKHNEVRKAMALVREHRRDFVLRWRQIHG